MQNVGLGEAHAGIKISRINTNNLRYADDTTLMAESIKSLLKKVKDESEKAGLKLNIKNIMITASFIVTSWQMEGEKVEERTNFISSDSKITMDGNCSHKIKTLASWKENYDKHRQHIKNQRHHFANKSLYIQNMAFPIVIYR